MSKDIETRDLHYNLGDGVEDTQVMLTAPIGVTEGKMVRDALQALAKRYYQIQGKKWRHKT